MTRPTLASVLLVVSLVAGCTAASQSSPRMSPTRSPTSAPTPNPTSAPTPSPTSAPIPSPTSAPIPSPTSAPIPSPTSAPIPSPTFIAGQIELARVNVARADSSDPDAAEAAAGINAFGFDLHRALAKSGGNVVFSPTSIAIALGMARAGARGETAAQMDGVLRDVASDEHANWLNSLEQALSARSGTFEDDQGTTHELTLDLTNAAFAQRDYAFEDAFLEALASRFGAGVNLVDFATDPQAARLLINAWASEQTRERIPEVLKPDDVSAATRLALVNAIYLKAPWYRPFPAHQTSTDPFTRPDGSVIDVPTMHSSEGASCATGEGWGAMDLPYLGHTLSMLVVVPDDLVAFEADLDADRLASIDRAFTDQVAVADVSLPKFDFETRKSLISILVKLGMPNAFDPGAADFSGMTAEDRLYIGMVIHQANISVDEKGTEAAAVTVVGMDSSGGGPTDVCTVRADRPFLFAIRDRETGAILFMGRVVDPAASH